MKNASYEVEKHKHHTIPVGTSIENLQWHLDHLFDSDSGFSGWQTIIEMTPLEHSNHHKKDAKEWGKRKGNNWFFPSGAEQLKMKIKIKNGWKFVTFT